MAVGFMPAIRALNQAVLKVVERGASALALPYKGNTISFIRFAERRQGYDSAISVGFH
jgi:hypothetical protein